MEKGMHRYGLEGEAKIAHTTQGGQRRDFAHPADRIEQKRLVGGWADWRALGPYLGCHQALWSRTKAHHDELARPQLGDAKAAQRLHVHEYVGRALATGEEAEATQPVEPFDLGPLEAAGRRYGDMGAGRWHLRRVHRRRLVHGQNTEGLQSARAL